MSHFILHTGCSKRIMQSEDHGIHWQSAFMEMKVEGRKKEILLCSCLRHAWVWELPRLCVRNADMTSVVIVP